MDRMHRYIEFRPAGYSASGSTQVWEVWNIFHHEKIGEVRWYGAWRKYAFYTEAGIYEAACLRFIGDFCDKVSGEHRALRARQRGERRLGTNGQDRQDGEEGDDRGGDEGLGHARRVPKR